MDIIRALMTDAKVTHAHHETGVVMRRHVSC
jgi:hypothetical protein